MYYQEFWDGNSFIFKIKTTPNGKWKQKNPSLADLDCAVTSKKISIQNAIDWAYLLGQTSAEKQGQ